MARSRTLRVMVMVISSLCCVRLCVFRSPAVGARRRLVWQNVCIVAKLYAPHGTTSCEGSSMTKKHKQQKSSHDDTTKAIPLIPSAPGTIIILSLLLLLFSTGNATIAAGSHPTKNSILPYTECRYFDQSMGLCSNTATYFVICVKSYVMR